MTTPKNVHDLDTLAPRPSRRSKMRAIYDAVDACGGSATAKEVRQVLPLTDDITMFNINGDAPTMRSVQQGLSSAVWSGYLVYLNGVWKIAPVSYYRAKAAEKAEANKKYLAKESVKRTKTQNPIVESPTVSQVTLKASPQDDGHVTLRISKSHLTSLLLLLVGAAAAAVGYYLGGV